MILHFLDIGVIFDHMESELSRKDRQYVWHPFTPQQPLPEPIVVTRGQGSLLFDENGNSYIDAISSWWVNLHGHSHPYIAEKVYRQALTLEQVIFAGFTHRPAVELAERMIPLLPGPFKKVFYSDNGSTATEVAIKMAIQYWWNQERDAKGPGGFPRKKILAFRDGYHGDTFGAMSVSDRGVFTMAFHDLLFQVIFIDKPKTEHLEEIRAMAQAESKEIACFIYEPMVQGAGGMKMHDPSLLNELLDTFKKAGIICIADEVMTGFGRTGRIFASDYLQVKPDIICLSKGLTGGTMALGLTACTEKIYQAFCSDDRLHTFFHGHSFTANPLACTAALASLDLLERKECLLAIEKITASNNRFVERLRFTNASQTARIRDIRQAGTIVAFEITSGSDGYLNHISAEITRKALARGVYLRPLGNTVYLMPPYCILPEELEKVYQTILEIIETC